MPQGFPVTTQAIQNFMAVDNLMARQYKQRLL